MHPLLGTHKVLCIPLRGPIDYTQECIVRRGLKIAEKLHYEGVILDIHTPGGRLDNTLNILQLLERYKGKKVAYINTEAISAGSYIALVCDLIYFHPTGIVGAAAVIDERGQSLNPTLQKKMDSYLLARMRSYINGTYRYNVQRAMLDANYILTVDGKTLKRKDELLTLTAQEACHLYGHPSSPLLGNGIVCSTEALATTVFGNDVDVAIFQLTGFESLAKYLMPYVPFLSAIGFLCLFIEFKTPGFGLFGCFGIICMMLPLWTNFLAGLAGMEVFFILLLGASCILLDALYIGSIFVTCIGLILILGSLWWSCMDIWPHEGITLKNAFAPIKDFLYAGILFAIGLIFLWKRGFLKKSFQYLQLTQQVHGTLQVRKDLIGQEAVVLSPLIPYGKVCVEDQILEARLLNGSAQPGERVILIGYQNFSYLAVKK
jgi:membrane-bound serine protease (ClpP class)